MDWFIFGVNDRSVLIKVYSQMIGINQLSIIWLNSRFRLMNNRSIKIANFEGIDQIIIPLFEPVWSTCIETIFSCVLDKDQ